MLGTPTNPSLLDLNQFLDPTVVRIGEKGLGQSIDPETGVFVLGYETTDAEFDVLHELCHFAEREPEKLVLRPWRGWGFSNGYFWQIGRHSGWEMRSDKDVRREIRTFAFQHAVSSALGWPSDLSVYAKLGRFLDGWVFYGKEEGVSGDEARFELAARQIEELSQTVFTFDVFTSALTERFDLLKRTPWVKVE